jgi:hypothetical protein
MFKVTTKAVKVETDLVVVYLLGHLLLERFFS